MSQAEDTVSRLSLPLRRMSRGDYPRARKQADCRKTSNMEKMMRRLFLQTILGFLALSAVGCGQVSPTAPGPLGSGGAGAFAAGGAQTVPLKGTLEGTSAVTPLSPPFASVVITAAGNATQLGQFTLHAPHIVNFATANGEGTFTFTAANGDRLTAAFAGHANTTTPIFSIEEHATITGGTGRFEGATGTFAVHRLFNPADGTTTGSFEGTLVF
jgi:hypothetical protein